MSCMITGTQGLFFFSTTTTFPTLQPPSLRLSYGPTNTVQETSERGPSGLCLSTFSNFPLEKFYPTVPLTSQRLQLTDLGFLIGREMQTICIRQIARLRAVLSYQEGIGK